MNQKAFLTAQWEYLAMLNYEVPAEVLQTHIPPGTEIDFWQGKAMVSVVGFLFNNTKVFGARWPGHTHFEEVNLRYYVKHFDGSTWKRGVGFVSEIVPKPIIAAIANRKYNEHYQALPMQHSITLNDEMITADYKWRYKNKWCNLGIQAEAELQDIMPGSEEEFILEHYWGYNALSSTTTMEYGVEHLRWQTYHVTDYWLDADIAGLYGSEFVPYIQGVKPVSAFLARGSEVVIRRPQKIVI